MNKAEKLFLDLLSAALWQTPLDTSIYKLLCEEDWKEILIITQKHCVTPMITAKIMELPAEAHPPKSILYPMLIHQKRIEELNEKSSRVLADLSKEFSAAGLSFILLKGLGNAQYYPNPKHRVPGDIDLYFYGDDFQKVYIYTLPKQPTIHASNCHHFSFIEEDTSVEIHWQISSFFNNKWSKRLKQLVLEELTNNKKNHLHIHEEAIELLPDTLNAFYIFLHLFRHFLYEGVGMRQFSDWLLFLSEKKNKINREKFLNLAKQFDLLNAMQVLANCSIKYLKAPSDIFPFDFVENNQIEEKVMRDILTGGNFGNSHQNRNKEMSKKGMLKRYFNTIQRTMKFRDLMPHYTLWEPYYRARRRLLISLGIKNKDLSIRWE